MSEHLEPMILEISKCGEIDADFVNLDYPCPVCGKLLAYPFIWYVFANGHGTPWDFFIHLQCVSALENGRYFALN